MKYSLILLFSIFLFANCQSKEEKAQIKADAMIAEALANAKKLEEEALAKAAATTAQVEAKFGKKQAEKEQARLQAIAEKKVATQKAKAALRHTPNKALSQNNGFYVDNRNHHGVLIFLDGKLLFFDCSRFKTVYKNEEYNVGGITENNEMDIQAQYYKDRKGEVKIKATVLREITPTIVNGQCTQLVRRGWTYPRIPTFRAFMKTRRNYSMASFIADFKAKYNRTEVEIEKALDNSNFYKADFFQKAPFYGDHVPLVDALESIIQITN